MKNKILIAVLAAVILITLAGCGQMQTAQCEKSKTADTSSASVTSDTEASDDAAVENSSSAVDSEITTEKETTVPAPESTSKVSTQNTAQPSVSAKQDTQNKESASPKSTETSSKSTQTVTEKPVSATVSSDETTSNPTELVDNKYEPQETRRVTVVSGQTSTVNFNNKLKRGNLTVTKTSEDGLNEGVKFHLYGTSLSGIKVDEYAVTDKSGKAYFKDVLMGSGYTLEETDTAIRYVVPEKQTADIEWNKVTNKSFNNILKKWQLTVTKSDKETGKPQGDASLAGAKYGIYKGDQLIDTYTTDKNGQFTTKVYICGDDWSLREITPSEGYLLNTEALHIGAEAKLYTAEYNLASPLKALETVQKGKIAIIKHCDDGSTQIETPEKGAEFEVYLKKSGSYSKAKESERDILVCDENGFADSKDLPYGIYTVKQTKGWEGKELIS